MDICYLKTGFVTLKITGGDKGISNIQKWDKLESDNIPKSLENCYLQLIEYFSGKRKKFDIKLDLKGTEFQKKVWYELLNIPFGEIKSYKDIAINIGNKNASRAVGNANNKNPIPIIIPCHRVLGSNKKLVGYALGLDIKEELLKLENVKYLY